MSVQGWTVHRLGFTVVRQSIREVKDWLWALVEEAAPMAPAKVSATSRLFTSTVMRRCCFDVRGGVFGGGT